jgi:hypothetical protein
VDTDEDWSAIVLECAAEEQLAEIQQLAADMRCMASYPVLCKGLMLRLPTSPLSHGSELAAAVAPLGPTLTHLSLSNYSAAGTPAALLLCQALPRVKDVEVDALPNADLHDVPQLLLRCPSIKALTFHPFLIADDHILHSRQWALDMVKACALAAGAQRPGGQLAVCLPDLPADVLQAAREEWAFLSSYLAASVTSVVVTGPDDIDLLAPAVV